MDAFWSLTLFVALAAGGIGAFAGAVAVIERRRRDRRWWWAAATALAGAVLASMFGTASLLVHFRFGHGPESATPMRIVIFAASHPAYLGLVSMIVLSAVGWIVATFRPGKGRT